MLGGRERLQRVSVAGRGHGRTRIAVRFDNLCGSACAMGSMANASNSPQSSRRGAVLGVASARLDCPDSVLGNGCHPLERQELWRPRSVRVVRLPNRQRNLSGGVMALRSAVAGFVAYDHRHRCEYRRPVCRRCARLAWISARIQAGTAGGVFRHVRDAQLVRVSMVGRVAMSSSPTEQRPWLSVGRSAVADT